MLEPGDLLDSPGHSFSYRIEGLCCRLYDREELPWPCCRLSWHGKEPSWKRVGSRLVGDVACKRYPSYAVTGWDRWGTSWAAVVTDYENPLSKAEKDWMYSRTPAPGKTWPDEPF